MLKSLLFLISLILFSQKIFSSDSWQGMWIATDEWQSEYNVIIKQNGIGLLCSSSFRAVEHPVLVRNELILLLRKESVSS